VGEHIGQRELGRRVSRRFRAPASVSEHDMSIVGDFNGWDPTADPMVRHGDEFVVELDLEIGRTYRYRFLADGCRWLNDWSADDYAPNDHGGQDSVAIVGRTNRDDTADVGSAPGSATAHDHAAPSTPPVHRFVPRRQ
jgi:1,4-alpha-glucan branching enzyme